MRSKKILAVILAVVLVMMIPVTASARAHLVVMHGIYDGHRHHYIVVEINGEPKAFHYGDSTQFHDSYYHPGDEVRVVVDANHPNMLLSMKITRVNYTPPHVSHDAYSVTGTVDDYDEMNTITIEVKGRDRTFDIEDADILHSPCGIEEGDVVKVVFSPDDRNVALQVIMVRHSDNHRDHGHPMHHQDYQSVTGNIVDASMNSITLFVQGRYMTFGKEDAEVDSGSGISVGDIVRIYFDPDNPNDAVRIQMIRAA